MKHTRLIALILIVVMTTFMFIGCTAADNVNHN